MSDTQYLFDLAARQYHETANIIEKHFEQVTDQIRDWLPQSSLIHNISPPPKRLPPPSIWTGLHRWIINNKTVVLFGVVVVGSGAIYTYLKFKPQRRRRKAKRTANGARTEVVILAGGCPMSPLSTGLALDLERRGYIVYMVVNSNEELKDINNLSRADIQPLLIDVTSPDTARTQVNRLNDFINRHHHSINGDRVGRLNLVGIIMVPDTRFQPGNVTAILPEEWSTLINSRILKLVLYTQYLLPLLHESQAKVLLLTPSIVPSLNLSGHALQSTIYGALKGFTSSLASDLLLQNISFCHFKLGHIDFEQKLTSRRVQSILFPPTHPRVLYESVCKALQSKTLIRTWYVGTGSLSYDIIGKIIPTNIIHWLLSFNRPKNDISNIVNDSKVGESETSSTQWEHIDSQ